MNVKRKHITEIGTGNREIRSTENTGVPEFPVFLFIPVNEVRLYCT